MIFMYDLLKTIYFSVPMVSFALFLISLCTYACAKKHGEHDHSAHIVQKINNLKFWFVSSAVFCGAMASVLVIFSVVLYISAI